MKVRRHKKWTQGERDCLRENWGEMSVRGIAKKLNRTETAVTIQAKRLGLGSPYMTTCLTANQAAKILGIDNHTITDYWIPRCGLRARTRAMRKQKMWQICIGELTKWLKNNQDKWDSRKVELYALGQEPGWLKQKRRADMSLPAKRFQKWTKDEESMLTNYYCMGKTQREIGRILGRTESGVQRKISRLKEKGLLEKDKILCHWSDEEVEMLLEFEKQGMSDIEIAWELGREVDHIRDKRRRLRKEGIYKQKRKTGYRKNGAREFLERGVM